MPGSAALNRNRVVTNVSWRVADLEGVSAWLVRVVIGISDSPFCRAAALAEYAHQGGGRLLRGVRASTVWEPDADGPAADRTRSRGGGGPAATGARASLPALAAGHGVRRARAIHQEDHRERLD